MCDVTDASVTILAVKNPSDEVENATILAERPGLTPEAVIEEFGDKIERGAFVSLTERDEGGNTTNVLLYVADRSGDSLYLQDNGNIGPDYGADIDDIGDVIESGYAPLADPEPELETFTVFGNNDDGEDFVAVVSATEDTVRETGVQAGLVDPGFEDSVSIGLILKGDHSDLENVAV